MSWTDLPTDYTDATWSGRRKYQMITNEDGTVSFEDVTEYLNKEKSYFGARDTNDITGAINDLAASKAGADHSHTLWKLDGVLPVSKGGTGQSSMINVLSAFQMYSETNYTTAEEKQEFAEWCFPGTDSASVATREAIEAAPAGSVYSIGGWIGYFRIRMLGVTLPTSGLKSLGRLDVGFEIIGTPAVTGRAKYTLNGQTKYKPIIGQIAPDNQNVYLYYDPEDAQIESADLLLVISVPFVVMGE